MKAIRIIRQSHQPTVDLTSIERDEIMRKVAEIIANAQGKGYAEKVSEVLEKLQQLNLDQEMIEEHLTAMAYQLNDTKRIGDCHSEIDKDRVLDLLAD